MTHYIKFEYTRWDRWKRLSKEFCLSVRLRISYYAHFALMLILLGLGWLGFFGSDPKFFPDGGLIQKIGRKIGVLKNDRR